MTGRLIGGITRLLRERDRERERHEPSRRRIPPPPAVERLRQLLATRIVTTLQAAAALTVPETELQGWLTGWSWVPTMQTCRDIHAWADRVWAGDRTTKGVRRLK